MSDEHDSIELSFLTIHRGEAAVRWVDRLKGKKTLQEVKWRMLALNDRLGIKQQAAQGKISVRLLEFAEPMIAEAARKRNPERWAGKTRNWERVEIVTLNTEREKSAA